MKNLKTFEQFVNEGTENLNEGAYFGPFKKVVDAVYNIKLFPGYDKRDLEWKKDDLGYALGNAGFDENITLAKIPSDPNFAKLSDDRQNDIMVAAGIGGRTPNQKFIKALSANIRAFGTDKNEDLYDRMWNALSLHEDMQDNDWPKSYTGFPYQLRVNLRKEFGYDYEVFKKLTDEERKHLQKLFKPVYDKFIKGMLTDRNFENLSKKELERYYPRPDYSSYNAKVTNETRFMECRWDQKELMPLLDYIKKTMLEKMSSPKWETFKVTKLDSVGAEHGTVVSSSFSTTYYYSAVVELDGKTFKFPKFILGSDYYSGGWN